MEAYRKNKELAQAARHIFGDIVENAYIVVTYIPEDSQLSKKYKDVHDQYRERMFKNLANPNFNFQGDTLHWDALNFAIHFSNGNIVYFTNSEWARLTKIDLRTDKYIGV